MKQHVRFKSTSLFCSFQRVSLRWQASAHRIVHCHDSQRWKQSRNHLHHRESCRANFEAQRFSIQLPRECPLSSVTPPVTQECTHGIPDFLCEGQVYSTGPRQQGHDGGKGMEQLKFFQELGLCHGPGDAAEINDICDGTFPNPVHEGVNGEEDISCFTMLKSYHFAKYGPQFNKLHAEWSYKVTVLKQ
ncbi:hypothetical protein TNCV_3265381 [Trichonephila clavipes]|nr:hypothetical protein TNCV_3265381 [Trichonephila clavipes]